MMHGFLTEGDRSVEAVAVAARTTVLRAAQFLTSFLHYPGEPCPPPPEELVKHEEDFDLKTHNSDSCRTCLAVRHTADKCASRRIC